MVAGAGLAGLAAAWELMRAGHDAIVLEASERAGGRVRTIRAPFADGQIAEAGATFVADHHRRVLGYVREFGLTAPALPARPGGDAYVVRGVAVGASLDPAAAWPLPLTAEERALGLAGLWRRYIGSALDAIGDPTAADWPPPAVVGWDRMTGAEFLRARGASEGAVELLRLGYLDLWGDGLASYSALAMLRDWRLGHGARATRAIAGGNDRLPSAVATALGPRVRYRTEVIGVAQDGRGVRVRARRGVAEETVEGDALVCALPPPLLAALAAPDWSAAKRAALAAIPTTSVARVAVQFARRPWRDEARMSVNTDLPVQWLWEASGGSAERRTVLEAYAVGPEARRVCAMDEASRRAWAMRDMTRIFPQLRGADEAAVSTCWDAEPWARGAYAWFRPGQLTTLGDALARSEGRVHFAGDHASHRPGWMEGALDSGVRAAHEIDTRAREEWR